MKLASVFTPLSDYMLGRLFAFGYIRGMLHATEP
jgi:hypothetical protein